MSEDQAAQGSGSMVRTLITRRTQRAAIVALAPILLATGLALYLQNDQAARMRYVLAFGDLGHRLEIVDQNFSMQRQSDKDFRELLRVFAALRASDPDGSEMLDGNDREVGDGVTALNERFGIVAADEAALRGLVSGSMPESLEALWEADKADAPLHASAGSTSLEALVAETLSIVGARYLDHAEHGADVHAGHDEAAHAAPSPSEASALATATHMAAVKSAIRSIEDVLIHEMRVMEWGPRALSVLVLAVASIASFSAYRLIFMPLADQVAMATEAVNAARKKAERAEAAKSEFLATMSHEIRTPMNGVIGVAELMAGTKLNARQKMFIEVINSSAHTLLGLINEILDFAKIDAGRLSLNVAPFKLDMLVREPTAIVAATAGSKGIELAARVAPDAPSKVEGDLARLRQVVVNFVSNAVKFTSSGQVVVDLATREAPPGPDGAARVRLRLEVRDTGCGIAPEDAALVFERFAQVDGSMTRAQQGTGLGLAIAKGLVELMGGEIGVESTLGVGSTFWFELDLPVHEAVEAAARVPRDLSGLRVLAIDDNETNRLILEEQLSAWRFSCATAASGREGLAALKRAAEKGAPFNVVLLDHHMPGMSGGEVLSEIRAAPKIAQVAVVLLSSLDEEIAMDSELQGRLVKPAICSALLDAIVEAAHSEQARTPALAGPAEAAPDAEGPAADGRDGERPDVLIVDDNDINRLVAEQSLIQLGLSCVSAADGAEALEMAAAHKPRIILMDVSMPVMDGFAATARLREIEERTGAARTPIIALTAHAFDGDRKRCLDNGMDDYLSKPIVGDALRLAIDTWLDEARRPAEPRRDTA